jgi:hypothetical protein
MRKRGAAISHRELTTVLTTTMTTVGLADTSSYTTTELVPSLVEPSACTYGSEGWGFESLRARHNQTRAALTRVLSGIQMEDSSKNAVKQSAAQTRWRSHHEAKNRVRGL